MQEVALTIEVNKPVGELFAFAINPANTPKWIRAIAVEETNEWPIQLGTVYRNHGEANEWTEYTVTALKENELFELKKKGDSYRVRYAFTPLSSASSKLEYTEMVEGGQIEQPFTQGALDKLKQVIESSET
jgi:hypothetical protein